MLSHSPVFQIVLRVVGNCEVQARNGSTKNNLFEFSALFAIDSLLIDILCGRDSSCTMKEIKKLCDIIRQSAYDIQVYHGHGHLEKVYENALAHRLRKPGWRWGSIFRSMSMTRTAR